MTKRAKTKIKRKLKEVVLSLKGFALAFELFYIFTLTIFPLKYHELMNEEFFLKL